MIDPNLPLTLADPLTLAAIGAGIGGLAGVGTAAASIFGPKPKAPSMPTPAPPVESPVGSPTSNAPTGVQPSFLAAAAAPGQQSLGNKSLLGQ